MEHFVIFGSFNDALSQFMFSIEPDILEYTNQISKNTEHDIARWFVEAEEGKWGLIGW